MKKILSAKGGKLWMAVSILLVLLLTTVTVLGTQVKDFYELLNMVMPGGGERAVYAEGIESIYFSDYDTKAEVYEAARDMNQEICEEGMVLLKNENGALPLKTPVSDSSISAKAKISVFGKNSVNIAYGGSGSGGSNDSNAVDLYTALEAAGYEINPTLKAFYEDTGKSGEKRKGNSKNLDSGDTVILATAETPQSMYTDEVKNSYANYKDAAFILITRIGGEGFDMPRKMTGSTGYRNEDDHFLQLDAAEEELVAAVCEAGFDRVILLVNSGTPIELGFLEADTGYVTAKGYKIDPAKIDAAVWMGFPGETGTRALANILNGSVNPSGKLADTYSVDFKQDPTWNNFGDNRLTAKSGTPGGDQYVFDVSAREQPSVPYYFVDYEEGVYVGYRYYETRGAEDEAWYKSHVVYPFGYGLSYTSFSWELEDASALSGKAIEKEGKYTLRVKVTNTGSVAGKEVVELYGHAPYTAGQIEKPEEVLLDYAKTSLLAPGASEVVEVTLDPYYLASYDYKDANGNGFAGYELDAGDYAAYISHDAHTKEFTVPFTVSANIRYDMDTVTGENPVENRFTDCEDPRFNSDTSLETVLSRSDWEGTWPAEPTEEERKGSKELLTWLNDKSHNNPTNLKGVDMPFSEEANGMTLRDLLYNEDGTYHDGNGDGVPDADYDDPRWDKLLDQASVASMINSYDYASYHVEAINAIGLPRINCADGPVGWACFMDQTRFYDTCSYCCQTMVATTWNTELAEKFGQMVGNEGVVGNERGDKLPYSGWYAPGVNIHRSPFGGRNFEYYSEDGLLAGRMAGAQIRGCNSRGVFTFVKHFALNEQETHRSISGDSSWVTEQAMREIFLRPFELAVKEGETHAVMTSFNRIGTRWTGGDYRLCTDILRNEWGFKGTVLCDFNTIPAYMNSRQMAYAGGDLNLATQPVSWCDESSAADVTILRQNMKNTLYAVVNSNAMNGEVIGYETPYWVYGLIAVDVIVAILLILWGVLLAKKAKQQPQGDKVIEIRES
ncbi:MAG: glycoside hydrolase family 3 C-terminal domain-containing protein [Lachnospiraceae bacterium]|nr:glycoside hydrolase family 3 C-terminal domain-containing protein [Lachnospiraceae bacterium]